MSKKIKNSVYSSGTGYGEAGASYRKKSLKALKAHSTSPNEDINYNLATLRRRSRTLYMGAPIATAAMKTMRTNIVGLGLIPSSKIDYEFLGISQKSAEKTQKEINRWFDLWANDKRSCDATGMNDFYDLEGIGLMSAIMNGDGFALIKRKKATPERPLTLRIDLKEADLVSTPSGNTSYSSIVTDGINTKNNNKIYDGVEVDKDGMIVAYHVCNQYPYEMKYSSAAKWTRIEVEGKLTGTPNILHICNVERAGQLRGVPFIAQIIEPLLQMGRYTESELMAALVNSFFTAFITTEKETNILQGEDVDIANENDTDIAIGTGTINQLNPGESVTFGDPKHPNSGFDIFMITLCKLVSAALELPHEIVLKCFNSNYSASRAAIMEAWKVFLAYRRWFKSDFCTPIWKMVIDELVATGKISAPGYFDNILVREAYCGATWTGPTQGQLDPIKEVQAEKLKVEEGFSTREESTRNLTGGDYSINARQLKTENKLLKEANSYLSEKASVTTQLSEEKKQNNEDKNDNNENDDNGKEQDG